MIVAQALTDQDADGPSQVAPLLDQIDDRIARVTADGAYDGDPTYQTPSLSSPKGGEASDGCPSNDRLADRPCTAAGMHVQSHTHDSFAITGP